MKTKTVNLINVLDQEYFFLQDKKYVRTGVYKSISCKEMITARNYGQSFGDQYFFPDTLLVQVKEKILVRDLPLGTILSINGEYYQLLGNTNGEKCLVHV